MSVQQKLSRVSPFRSAIQPTVAGTIEPATPKARHLPGLRGCLAPVPRLCAAGFLAEAPRWIDFSQGRLRQKLCYC